MVRDAGLNLRLSLKKRTLSPLSHHYRMRFAFWVGCEVIVQLHLGESPMTRRVPLNAWEYSPGWRLVWNDRGSEVDVYRTSIGTDWASVRVPVNR